MSGARVTHLSTLQVLAVAEAALVIAEGAGITVRHFSAYAGGYAAVITLSPDDGDGPELAAALGLTGQRTQPHDDGTLIEVFTGMLRGVDLTVQHNIPDPSAPVGEVPALAGVVLS